MTVSLKIAFFGIEQLLLFDTKEAAETELDLLEKAIADSKDYSVNARKYTHRVKTPTGDTVVALDQVHCARIVLEDKFLEMVTPNDDKRLEIVTKRLVDIKQKLKDSDLDQNVAIVGSSL